MTQEELVSSYMVVPTYDPAYYPYYPYYWYPYPNYPYYYYPPAIYYPYCGKKLAPHICGE